MNIKTWVVSPFQQNARLLWEDSQKHGVMIDPGDDIPEIIAFIKAHGITIKQLILTHSHIDHAGGVENFLEQIGHLQQTEPPTFYAHKAEKIMRENIDMQIAMFGLPDTYKNVREPDVYLKGGEQLTLAGEKAEVRFTPGHSPGHIVLYFDAIELIQDSPQALKNTHTGPVLVAGDTLFSGSIGRTDLPGGDHQTLLRSIHTQLLTCPEDTLVLSGHGPDTTIGSEKTGNPFLTEPH